MKIIPLRAKFFFALVLASLFQQALAADKKEPLSLSTTFIQQTILKDINSYRLKRGLEPLQLINRISLVAEKHSIEMASQTVPFGHLYFNERIDELAKEIKRYEAGAENVAYAYPFNTVVKNWLTSRGHRRNIEGNYNLTGIGIAYDNKGKIYYTQIFLRAPH